MNASNSSAPNASSEPSALVRNSMLYTLTITGSITIIMNLFVLAVVWRYRWMRTNANLIIASMAVTDLVAGLSTVTSGLIKWTDHFNVSDTFCVIYNIVDITVAFASLQHVVGVNLERYIAIIKPLQYKKLFTKAKLYLYIVSAWLWSLFLTLMYVFNMILLDKCLQDIPKRPIWTLVSLVFSYPVPLLTIIVIYIHIVIVIIRQLNFQKKHGSGNVRIKSKQLKMIKNVAIIFVAYVVCWAPTMSVLMAVSMSLLLGINLDFSNFVTMFYFVEVLSYANSLVNPIIYFLGSRSFQRAARKMFHMKETSIQAQATASTSLQKSGNNKSKSSLCKDENNTVGNESTRNTATGSIKDSSNNASGPTKLLKSDTEVVFEENCTHAESNEVVEGSGAFLRGIEGNTGNTEHDSGQNDGMMCGKDNDGARTACEKTSDGKNNEGFQTDNLEGYVNQVTDSTRL